MDIPYTYTIFDKHIMELKNKYYFLEVSSIGKSVEKRNLYLLKFGFGKRKVFICGGTHGCEWITVPVLMKWIDEICQSYSQQGEIYGKEIRKLFEKTTIYMLPMVNPDGIELQIKGLSPDHKDYEKLIRMNNGNKDFSKWKANIRGVDLNRNYNAGWKECKDLEKELGITGPWLESYGGPYPESEPETLAITKLTRDQKFDMVLSYHTQGRVIYWTFDNIYIKGARGIGNKLSKVSGYELDIPEINASYGGYKDWFIKEFRRPGFTIECGYGENPLPISQFDEIYNENKELLLVATWG